MRFLLLTPGFRQIIVDEVLLFLRRKVEIFSHDAEHSLATIIDARRDTALVGRLYKETVKEIFSDISEEAIRAAIQHHAPRGTETIPAEGAQLVDERDLRTKVRNAAKMEYSQRIARAVRHFAPKLKLKLTRCPFPDRTDCCRKYVRVAQHPQAGHP